MNRRHWSNIARLVLVVGVLWLLFHFNVIHFEALRRSLTSPRALLASFVCIFAALNISIVRWAIILYVQGFQFSFWRIWHIAYMGAFANAFLPGGIGGDAFRMYYVEREGGGKRGKASLSVVTDRVMGFLGLVVAASVIVLLNIDALIATRPLRQMAILVALLLAGFLIAFALLHYLGTHPSIRHVVLRCAAKSDILGRLLTSLLEVMRAYRHSKPEMAICLGLSVVGQFLMAGAIVSIAQSMQLGHLTSLDAALAGLLSYIANMLPITPGGIGIGEGAFDQICRFLVGTTTSIPFGTAFLVTRAVSYCAVMPGAASYLIYGKPRSKMSKEENAVS